MATGRKPGAASRMATLTRLLLLGWQSLVLLEAIRRGGGKPGLGRRNGWPVALTLFHVDPHLTVGDVTAGQRINPQRREDQSSTNDRDRQGRESPSRGGVTPVGLRPPYV